MWDRPPGSGPGYGWDFGAEVLGGHCWCGGRAGPGGAGLEHVARELVSKRVHTHVLLWFAMGEYLFVFPLLFRFPQK